MRSERKEYRDRLEKEVRRDYKEWQALSYNRWGRPAAGEYVELAKPVQNGYDLVLLVNLKESDGRKEALEECYSKLYRTIHSSGREFRKCDCRKSMRYRARDDVELDSYFTNNRLDFEKVSDYVLKKICDYEYDRLSDGAKRYFVRCPAFDWQGNLLKNRFEYKFQDDDHIPYHFEVRPHYVTCRFVPDGKAISRGDFLDRRLWVGRLWYAVLSEGDNYPSPRLELRLRRAEQDKKYWKSALAEYELEADKGAAFAC